jgi:hypothetical protein
MTTPQDTLTDPVSIKVTASTNNPKDKGYYHYFQQESGIILTFEVYTDPAVDSIYFVLWNLNDPVNPEIAEPPKDWNVTNGHVAIKIGPHFPMHLGPGPYCATLTASRPTASSAASKGAREIVGNAIYYYDTWKDSRRYVWPALS